jgi:hypothetical protein
MRGDQALALARQLGGAGFGPAEAQAAAPALALLAVRRPGWRAHLAGVAAKLGDVVTVYFDHLVTAHKDGEPPAEDDVNWGDA